MNKYLKYTSLILASFVLVAPAYAEVAAIPPKPGQEARVEFKDLKKNEIEGVKNTREELKKGVMDTKNGLKEGIADTKNLLPTVDREKIDALKKELEAKRGEMKTTMEAKRAEFKTLIDTKREGAKVKIEAAKEKLKTDLLKIKDEKKKETVTRITDKIVELNTKATDNLTANINKIDEILTRIKTQVATEKAKGTDVAASEASIVLADKSIADAKTAILAQSTKSYSAVITTETALQNAMSKIKDLFNADIKAVREKVQAAHVSVKNAMITLPKVEAPKLIEGTNPTVEEGTTNQ